MTTGISSEDYVEITKGIKEGEEVIADLGDYTEGIEVQAVPELHFPRNILHASWWHYLTALHPVPHPSA